MFEACEHETEPECPVCVEQQLYAEVRRQVQRELEERHEEVTARLQQMIEDTRSLQHQRELYIKQLEADLAKARGIDG